MSKNNNINDFNEDLANTLRQKLEMSELINPQDFSDFINLIPLGDTFNNYSTGNITKTSNTTIDNVSINCGFRPKVFLLRNVDAIYTNSTDTPYKCTMAFSAYTKEFNFGGTAFVLRGGTYSSSTPSRGGTSIGGNYFAPTDNGVQGYGGTVILPANMQYAWFAWG